MIRSWVPARLSPSRPASTCITGVTREVECTRLNLSHSYIVPMALSSPHRTRLTRASPKRLGPRNRIRHVLRLYEQAGFTEVDQLYGFRRDHPPA
jgi:hypothetical protein